MRAYMTFDTTTADRLFAPVLVAFLTAAMILGTTMGRVTPPKVSLATVDARAVQAHLIVQQPDVPPLAPPKPVVREKRPEQKPLDLTDNPRLSADSDRKEETVRTQEPVRQVYGLRKVYATGIGAGSGGADGVVAKLGNTLDKPFDTVTASRDDIRGVVVSTTTVTSAPKFRRRVRPEYTEEMLADRIEGVVRVRVLVDSDGRVKVAQALNDIGGRAAHQAVKASLDMEFEPAKRGEETVAVWIIVPIRFVMLG